MRSNSCTRSKAQTVSKRSTFETDPLSVTHIHRHRHCSIPQLSGVRHRHCAFWRFLRQLGKPTERRKTQLNQRGTNERTIKIITQSIVRTLIPPSNSLPLVCRMIIGQSHILRRVFRSQQKSSPPTIKIAGSTSTKKLRPSKYSSPFRRVLSLFPFLLLLISLVFLLCAAQSESESDRK